MSTSESFVISEAAAPSDNDDVDSLASISSGDLSSEADSDAQREWEASLAQLQLLLTMILIPFAGKYLGRKFAYWSKLDWEAASSGAAATDTLLQAGRDTWNGSTMSRYDGRTRGPSKRLGPSKLRLHYDDGLAEAWSTAYGQAGYIHEHLVVTGVPG